MRPNQFTPANGASCADGALTAQKHEDRPMRAARCPGKPENMMRSRSPHIPEIAIRCKSHFWLLAFRSCRRVVSQSESCKSRSTSGESRNYQAGERVEGAREAAPVVHVLQQVLDPHPRVAGLKRLAQLAQLRWDQQCVGSLQFEPAIADRGKTVTRQTVRGGAWSKLAMILARNSCGSVGRPRFW